MCRLSVTYLSRLVSCVALVLCSCTASVYAQAVSDDRSAQRIKFDTYFGRGVLAMATNEYDKAYALLSHAYRLDSTDAALRYQLSALYNGMGYSHEAFKLLRGAYHSDKGNRYYAVALASLYISRSEYSNAIDIYKRLCKDYPEEIDLVYLLARLYSVGGEVSAAEKIYDRLERESKNETEAARAVEAKVQLLSSQQRTEDALAAYQRLSDRFPDEPSFILPYIGALIDAERYPQARKQLKRLAGIDSTSGVYHFAMASYYLSVDSTSQVQQQLTRIADDPNIKLDQKLPLISRFVFADTDEDDIPRTAYNGLFERMLAADPTDAALRLLYTRILGMQQNIPEAIRICIPVTEMYPEEVQGWNFLLGFAIESRDNERIRMICQKARVFVPNQAVFYMYEAIVEHEEGQKAKAQSILQNGIQQVTTQTDPTGLSDLYSMLADLTHDAGKTKEAFAYYEKALEINPDNAGVLNNYAYFLADSGGDIDKALRLASRCIQLEPNNPTYLDTYGYMYFLKGQYSLAKLYIERAVEKSKDAPDADILEHLGDVLYKLGQADQAVSLWRKAKETGNGGSDKLEQKIQTQKYI